MKQAKIISKRKIQRFTALFNIECIARLCSVRPKEKGKDDQLCKSSLDSAASGYHIEYIPGFIWVFFASVALELTIKVLKLAL